MSVYSYVAERIHEYRFRGKVRCRFMVPLRIYLFDAGFLSHGYGIRMHMSWLDE